MEEEEFTGGEELAFQGSLADTFFVILSGGVVLSRRQISQQGIEEEYEVGTLGASSFFGDHALDHAAASTDDSERSTAGRSGKRGGRGGAKSPPGRKLAVARRKPPPVWNETITVDEHERVTRLLWITRDRFTELVGGSLQDVVKRNQIMRVLDEVGGSHGAPQPHHSSPLQPPTAPGSTRAHRDSGAAARCANWQRLTSPHAPHRCPSWPASQRRISSCSVRSCSPKHSRRALQSTRRVTRATPYTSFRRALSRSP